MEVNVNVNNIVSVKLTERGLIIYEEYIKSVEKLLGNSASGKKTREYYYRKLENNILTDQLWCIMEIFGSSFVHGNQPPFINVTVL